MRSRVASDEPQKWVWDVRKERRREAARWDHAERVPIQARVRRIDPPLLPAQPDPHRAALSLELLEHLRSVEAIEDARGYLR